MEVFFDIPEFNHSTTIAIGTFDGVHKGHRIVLEQACKMAEQDKTPTVVFTFVDHPAIITGSKKVPKLLTLSEEKIKLLESENFDYCIIIEFTKELSLLSPEEFIKEILIKKLKAKNKKMSDKIKENIKRKTGNPSLAQVSCSCANS